MKAAKIVTLTLLSILIIVSPLQCSKNRVSGLSTTEMILLVKEYGSVWNGADSKKLYELLSTEYLHYQAGALDADSILAMTENIAVLRKAFPDLTIELEEPMVAKDCVFGKWTLKGTHTGFFHDYPPTGNRIEIKGMSMFRIVEGKILEEHSYYDSSILLSSVTPPVTP